MPNHAKSLLHPDPCYRQMLPSARSTKAPLPFLKANSNIMKVPRPTGKKIIQRQFKACLTRIHQTLPGQKRPGLPTLLRTAKDQNHFRPSHSLTAMNATHPFLNTSKQVSETCLKSDERHDAAGITNNHGGYIPCH